MEAEDDFDDFARATWPGFVRTAVFLGCEHFEAQDIAQTALTKCWQSWGRLEGVRNRDAYAFRILHNCLRDARRRRSSSEVPSPGFALDGAATLDAAASVDDADAVHRALGGLSPGVREVVVLRFLVGLSERETAQALRLPVGTVKSRGARGLARLAASTDLEELSGGRR